MGIHRSYWRWADLPRMSLLYSERRTARQFYHGCGDDGGDIGFSHGMIKLLGEGKGPSERFAHNKVTIWSNLVLDCLVVTK